MSLNHPIQLLYRKFVCSHFISIAPPFDRYLSINIHPAHYAPFSHYITPSLANIALYTYLPASSLCPLYIFRIIRHISLKFFKLIVIFSLDFNFSLNSFQYLFSISSYLHLFFIWFPSLSTFVFSTQLISIPHLPHYASIYHRAL